jgi:hypothetical protein
VWRNRPMQNLLKFRNLKERDFATVAEGKTTTHTRDHKNTNITTPDVNTAMSLCTLPY